MSRENVEVVRRGYDAFNRRDLDGFLSLMSDDVESRSRLVPVEGGFHGQDGVRRWWSSLLDNFPDMEIEVMDIRDLGDVILGEYRIRGHGAGSQIPVEDHQWQVVRFRGDKVSSWRVFLSEAEALEDARLRQ
jgi:ketosteroid isomerase-like protein